MNNRFRFPLQLIHTSWSKQFSFDIIWKYSKIFSSHFTPVYEGSTYLVIKNNINCNSFLDFQLHKLNLPWYFRKIERNCQVKKINKLEIFEQICPYFHVFQYSTSLNLNFRSESEGPEYWFYEEICNYARSEVLSVECQFTRGRHSLKIRIVKLKR